jgi:hypothetical protein
MLAMGSDQAFIKMTSAIAYFISPDDGGKIKECWYNNIEKATKQNGEKSVSMTLLSFVLIIKFKN